jgi:dipeptidyl aminopeptidase
MIRKNLGEVEAADQIAVAEEYAKLPYVDEKRIGIQGWSYGGYLTSRVIETNTTAFSLGIAVAPVTDWRYYDTIYTERYMGTLEENEAGYTKSAVTNMEGFKHADFLLMHGSGDDNGKLDSCLR